MFVGCYFLPPACHSPSFSPCLFCLPSLSSRSTLSSLLSLFSHFSSRSCLIRISFFLLCFSFLGVFSSGFGSHVLLHGWWQLSYDTRTKPCLKRPGSSRRSPLRKEASASETRSLTPAAFTASTESAEARCRRHWPSYEQTFEYEKTLAQEVVKQSINSRLVAARAARNSCRPCATHSRKQLSCPRALQETISLLDSIRPQDRVPGTLAAPPHHL